MERAASHPVRTLFFQRDIVLHDADNVRLTFQVIDEGLWKAHEELGFLFRSLSKFDDGRPRSPLVLPRRFEARDVWMAGQQICNRPPQCAGAVAVDYAQFTQPVQESFVEKLVDEVDGFVRFLTD